MHSVPRVGVGVLVIRNNTLLLGQRLNSHGAHSWGPPGGHLEFAETFEACAIREVQEEIGVEIQYAKFLGVTNDIFIDERKHYISIFMKAILKINDSIKNLEPEKVVKWEWFAFDKLPEPLFLPLKNFLQQTEMTTI